MLQSLSLILGIVATPIIVSADKPEATKTSDVQVTPERPIENFRFYSPIIEALIPAVWELPVPDDLSRESEEMYRVRKRRDAVADADNSEENMVTAEQILFRPLFRHRQLVEEREQRLKAKQDQRRQALYNKYYSQLAQRKQYNPYQNYYPNYYSQINSQSGYYRPVRAALPSDYYQPAYY